MRSFLLCVVLFACVVVGCNATVIVQGFTDASCKTPTGPPFSTALPSSTNCIASGKESGLNVCIQDSAVVSYDFRFYNTSTSCSGSPSTYLVTSGATGGCNPTLVFANSVQLKVWSTVNCSASSSLSSPSDVADSLEEVVRSLLAAEQGMAAQRTLKDRLLGGGRGQ